MTATATEEGELVVAANDLWYTARRSGMPPVEDRVGVVKWPDARESR